MGSRNGSCGRFGRVSGLAVDPDALHLAHTVKVFVDHYNGSRPHRSLGLVAPNGRPAVKPETLSEPVVFHRPADIRAQARCSRLRIPD
jgi:hypothetical protein